MYFSILLQLFQISSCLTHITPKCVEINGRFYKILSMVTEGCFIFLPITVASTLSTMVSTTIDITDATNQYKRDNFYCGMD